MVAKKHLQTSIYIPRGYTDTQRELIGKHIIERIRQRTKSGINKDGNPFPGYTKTYAKMKGQDNVDLTLTDDMLTELSIISHKPGEIVIGYPLDHPDAGKVEGNSIGSYGQPTPNPAKARPFIGISQAEKDIILAKVEQASGVEAEKSKFLDTFINRLLGDQGDPDA